MLIFKAFIFQKREKMGDTCKQTEAVEQRFSILIIFQIYLLPIGARMDIWKGEIRLVWFNVGSGYHQKWDWIIIVDDKLLLFWMRISLCNILLQLCFLFNLHQFQTWGLLCLLLPVAKTLTVFLGNRILCASFALPLLLPLSLKCFFCLSPLHQHAGTQCFCTVGVGNLRRVFPALLFRLKSLQFSIATWIKKKN